MLDEGLAAESHEHESPDRVELPSERGPEAAPRVEAERAEDGRRDADGHHQQGQRGVEHGEGDPDGERLFYRRKPVSARATRSAPA